LPVIRAEQAQIRDEMLLVINGQHGIGGRGIGDIGIKRRLLRAFSQQVANRKDVLYYRERTSSGRMQRSEMNGADVIDMICRQGWHL
jgi:polysaccharide pyruvyl transferase WcaK-like protein